jgi:glucan phosphoethanolaminetransferase (alkaline phosphatase superfamily)
MFSALLRDLEQPEYVHTLLNPLPVYGLAVALFGFIAALYLRSLGGRRVGLILIFATAMSAWPVVHYGSAAYDRVLSLSDQAGEAWLAAHAHRADYVAIYYLLALVAVLTLFLPLKWPRTSWPLVWLTLVLAFAALACGSYIAYAGGKVRHREFRNTSPPPKPAES